jgi:putative transposase
VKYAFMREQRQEYPVEMMCRLLSVSKSGFYDWLDRGGHEVHPRRQAAQLAVKAVFEKKKKRYGSPRIHQELRNMGQRHSKTTVEETMRELGLRARPKQRYISTTDSNHSRPVAPNLLGRDFTTTERDAVWLSDITYLPMIGGGFCYLCAIMDLGSREIIGWAVDDNMEAELVIAALINAIESRGRIATDLIFHSDQGSQYAADGFRRLLRLYGIRQSMSRRGQCWDNAPMESFFSSLKEEYGDLFVFASLEDARSGMFDYIELFYNRNRLHSALGYQVPACYQAPVAEKCPN